MIKLFSRILGGSVTINGDWPQLRELGTCTSLPQFRAKHFIASGYTTSMQDDKTYCYSHFADS